IDSNRARSNSHANRKRKVALMHIVLSPQRRDDTLTVSKSGEILTINGEVFDFSTLPDGATIAAENSPSTWITGPIERIDGKLHLNLFLPHGSNPSDAVAITAPIIDPPDGPIDLPHDPEPEEAEDDVDD